MCLLMESMVTLGDGMGLLLELRLIEISDVDEEIPTTFLYSLSPTAMLEVLA